MKINVVALGDSVVQQKTEAVVLVLLILFSFLLPFVSFCCMHLYFMFTAVSYQMFFH